MVTRRLPEDGTPESYPESGGSPAPAARSNYTPTNQPAPGNPKAGLRPQQGGANRRKTHVQHMPRTLGQVLTEANESVIRGDMAEFVPIPTGFEPLDTLIGGGLRKTELVLLGGAQGIGKTIATLQIARNIAMRPEQYAFYISYEHTETHLMSRLLCLESISPPEIDLRNGFKLKDLFDTIISQRAKDMLGQGRSGGSLQNILRENPRTSMALARLGKYADRLIMVKASPAVTTLTTIREMTARLADATGGNISVFVDYLQKVAIHPERANDENDKVTIVVEGLKDIALSLSVPVWAIVASDREGLKAKRLHLHHLRGSSALDYECDIAVIMNNKYQIMAKDHVAFNPYATKQFRDWVVFTIEKNRAGRAMVDMEFQMHAPYFAFDTRGQQVQQQLIDDKMIES
jgi:replicative DNA helicase